MAVSSTKRSSLSQTVDITLRESGKSLSATVGDLENRTYEFLEYFTTPAFTDDEFRTVVGEGDGRRKFERLLSATGHEGKPRDFFKALLIQVESAPQTPVQVGGIAIPYHYLVSLLGVLIPQRGFLTIQTVDQLREVANVPVPEGDRENLQKVIDTYPVRISYHTIRQMMVSKDVSYQYLPFVEELDPVGHANTWIGQFHQGLLEQMYQNRVIFLLNMSCPVYCRFCFRKHKDSRNEANPTVEDVEKAIEHVANSPSIKEIIVTGGDPFMNRRNMAATIDGLMDVEHVQTLRLATRSVAYYPDLFLKNERSYLRYLQQKSLELQRNGKRMEIATHFIHPDEVSPESLELITEFVNSGITVYVQTPFLQDCNDEGPELKKLFGLLRGAGAEMHYIYIPCSPIHGNSVYWSTLADGIDIAEYLRAHLSDRSVPKICTATPIGKMEWYTSGWAVEPVEGKENFVWIRTPYTPEYFKSFAPLAKDLPTIRVNQEGTLDIQFMAKMGNDSYFLGSRPLRITKTQVPMELPEHLTLPEARAMIKGIPIVKTAPKHLKRLHETRVEVTTEAGDSEFTYIREHRLISDVIIAAPEDAVESLYDIERIVEELKDIHHVNAVRIRSLMFNYAPERFTPTVIRRMGELNSLTVADPLRLELETWFVTPDQLRPEHAALVRRLNNRGITVYSNTPLLGGINDNPDSICELTFAYRKAGIEFHHLYVAGLPLQKRWNIEHPVDMYDVIDIASKIRREGSGREGPRYIVQTEIGEVYYGLTSSFFHDGDDILMKLESYDLEYYRRMDPDFALPEGITLDEENKPTIRVPGLVSSTDFRI